MNYSENRSEVPNDDVQKEESVHTKITLTEEEQIAIAITYMESPLPMPPKSTKKVKFKINNRRKGLPSII